MIEEAELISSFWFSEMRPHRRHHHLYKQERRIEHYSSHQKILLIGEGDFSFAACLAYYFSDASNIVATSRDSRERVIQKYSQGERNLRELKERGALVIHGVDAHTMNNHPRLHGLRFDKIVFNFPHLGDTNGHSRLTRRRRRNLTSFSEHSTRYIQCNRHLVKGFLREARKMVERDGEIHVTHKTTHPFDKWRVAETGREAGLALTREVEFSKRNYPGYDNKKAYGRNWDMTFAVGESSTFVFCLPYSSAWYRLSP